MSDIKFADFHCDTITKIFDTPGDLYKNLCQVDIKKLSLYESVIQFFAVWLDEKYLFAPFSNTTKFIKYYVQQIGKYKIYFPDMKFFLAIEGGEALENDLTNLKKFYEMGVVLLTLTWNNENDLAGGINSMCGLKKFGLEVVELMDQLNMIIDISHASKKTFWDVYKNSQNSFVASHSNCREICNHPRNLDDDQIRAVKEKNGLIGLNLYSNFITEGSTDLFGLAKHVDHLLNLIGDNNICFGCDFDGADKYPRGIQNVSDMKKPYNLFKKLYGQVTADKIFYTNLEKFLVHRHYI